MVAMSEDQFQSLHDDVRYIRSTVDDVKKEQSDFRVSVEHRLTKVEVKSGIWGIIGGLLAGIGLHLKDR